jgi:predicted regulator of Ras-like GTPase activity (Roadblock/LC7/MglB family)
LDAIPEIKGLFVLDRNANLIAHALRKEEIIIAYTREESNVIMDKISISAGLVNLSGQKLVDLFDLGDLEHFLIKSHDSLLFINQIDKDRILLAILDPEARMGLIFLEVKKGLIEVIKKIPYSMPSRKINLQDRLNELEDEFIR